MATLLRERFRALQEALMESYESGATDLHSQLTYWHLVRKEQAVLYKARQDGLRTLGLQPVPTLQVSEYRAKEAISMTLLLKTFIKSHFVRESWTLQDVSAELVLHTKPKNTFKKRGYTVEVLFDHDPMKAFPYTNFSDIYYQDENEIWHKTEGKVDYDGMYYEEPNGDRVYFQLFDEDAHKYGQSGQWTVNYKNTTLSPPVTSSTRPTSSTSPFGISGTTNTETQQKTTFGRVQTAESASTSSPSPRGRRAQQGESPVPSKRRRRNGSAGQGTVPSPGEVGRRLRTVARTGLSRIRRLQEEARDPPIAIIKGPANPLKCWRNRCNQKYASLFVSMSTAWNWVNDNSTKEERSRLLVAFANNAQRDMFVKLVTFPRGTTYAFGKLDSL
ncbi:E2 [Human papillomavirus type 212]|uniref:Regulatory protein E2 n=1 Tax=Human papillomavirus type 212 TaxID=2060136 RepID=A0A2R4QL89_9PAPI|nr:E2 [Human papillomavirus type 212]